MTSPPICYSNSCKSKISQQILQAKTGCTHDCHKNNKDELSENSAIFFSGWQVLLQLQYSFDAFPNFTHFLLKARWFFLLSVYWRWVGRLLLSKIISLTGTYIICKKTVNMHNCLKTMEKQQKPWLWHKYITRAIVQTQSTCARGKVERGTRRDRHSTATSKQWVLHRNVRCLGRKTTERKAQVIQWLQEAVWEDVLTKNLGKRSRKNYSLVCMENKNGWRKTPGWTGYRPCQQDGGLDQALDQADTVLRNSVSYSLETTIYLEDKNQSIQYTLHEGPQMTDCWTLIYRGATERSLFLDKQLLPLQFLLATTIFFHFPPLLIASIISFLGTEQHPDLAL